MLNPEVFTDIDIIKDDAVLGRLTITKADGDYDGDGTYEEIVAFGGRSFSIYKASRRGYLHPIYDSGDELEKITASLLPQEFNSTNDENGSFDNRSDDKGPEPEGVTVGEVNGRTYAFIGLERQSAIMVYDVSNPYAPKFVQFVSNRDYTGDAEDSTAGDLGPEGLEFVPAEDSPNGKPLLVVANEVSGTVTVYQID